MKLNQRLKSIRKELGHSQESLGACGFVSTPGWIKIENGQREPSEKLIGQFVELVAKEKIENKKLFKKDAATHNAALTEELLTLKYLGSKSKFLSDMARARAATLPNGEELLKDAEDVPSKRGRPAKKTELAK